MTDSGQMGGSACRNRREPQVLCVWRRVYNSKQYRFTTNHDIYYPWKCLLLLSAYVSYFVKLSHSCCTVSMGSCTPFHVAHISVRSCHEG